MHKSHILQVINDMKTENKKGKLTRSSSAVNHVIMKHKYVMIYRFKN